MIGLRQHLATRQPLRGVLVRLPAADHVRVAAVAGLDLVVVDLEHGPADWMALDHVLAAATAADLPVLLRLASADPAVIGRGLDLGAAGIVVAHVATAVDAAACVAAARYPPFGVRSLALSTPAGRFGALGVDAHLRAAESVVVLAQIEEPEAVAAVRSVMTVEGIDGVLLGTTDLAAAFGELGTTVTPQLDEAIAVVLAAGDAERCAVAAVAHDPADVERWTDEGATPVLRVATSMLGEALRGLACAPARDAARSPSSALEPVLMLPGMACDETLFEGVQAGLPLGSFMPRMDLDEDMEQLATSVLAQAPPRFSLLGHSLGGIVALELLDRAPDRITGAVLVATSARPPTAEQLEYWNGLWDRIHAGHGEAVIAGLAAATSDGDQGLEAAAARMARAVGPAAIARQLAVQRSRRDLRPTLATIEVPVRVLAGGRDVVCDSALQDELAHGIPAGELVVVPRAGHLLPLEDPQAVARAMGALRGT